MPNEELVLLIDSLTKQVQGCLESQDRLRTYVQDRVDKVHHDVQSYVVKELAVTQGEVENLTKKLDNIEKNILDNQQRKFKQTIALQSAILLLVVGAALSYLIPLILGSFTHH